MVRSLSRFFRVERVHDLVGRADSDAAQAAVSDIASSPEHGGIASSSTIDDTDATLRASRHLAAFLGDCGITTCTTCSANRIRIGLMEAWIASLR